MTQAQKKKWKRRRKAMERASFLADGRYNGILGYHTIFAMINSGRNL